MIGARQAYTSPYLHYAVLSSCLLIAGIGMIRIVSVHIEQRVLGLILFCALQLVAIVIAIRLPARMYANLHWLFVSSYFVLALLANTVWPDLKHFLAVVFYGFCLALIALSLAALVQGLKKPGHKLT